MKKELDEKLCKKYPEIFAQRGLSMMETCMCWGFACGDGWYSLIDDLCKKIMLVCTWAKTVPPEAVQVKEKYGTLRFYIGGVSVYPEGLFDIIYDMISCAESRSGYTCEECGEYGKLYDGGWCVTRCEDCYSKYRNSTDKQWENDESLTALDLMMGNEKPKDGG